MTQDIEKSFSRMRGLSIVSVVASFVFALVVGVMAFNYAEQQRHKIYVLDQGKSLLLALQTDAIMSKDIEIRDHVTRFHELMFTLSPQKQTITENLDRALNLADRSAYDYSQDLAERGIIPDLFRPISPSRCWWTRSCFKATDTLIRSRPMPGSM